MRLNAAYHLIILNLETKRVDISSFSAAKIEQASASYEEVEKRMSNGEKIDSVLVSGVSISQLRQAYPNFFLDTNKFIEEVERKILK